MKISTSISRIVFIISYKNNEQDIVVPDKYIKAKKNNAGKRNVSLFVREGKIQLVVKNKFDVLDHLQDDIEYLIEKNKIEVTDIGAGIGKDVSVEESKGDMISIDDIFNLYPVLNIDDADGFTDFNVSANTKINENDVFWSIRSNKNIFTTFVGTNHGVQKSVHFKDLKDLLIESEKYVDRLLKEGVEVERVSFNK